MKKTIGAVISVILVLTMLFPSAAFADASGDAWFSDIKNSILDSFNGKEVNINEDVRIKVKTNGLSKAEEAALKTSSVILKINTTGDKKLLGFDVKFLGIKLLSGTVDWDKDGSLGVYVPRLTRSYYKLTPELTAELLSMASAEMGTASWDQTSEWIRSLDLQQIIDITSAELGTDLSGYGLTASVTYPSSAEVPDAQPVSVSTMGELNIAINSVMSSIPSLISKVSELM